MKLSFLYVNPKNNTGIPIGLSYLISILRNRGHEISLFETTFYDFDYSSFNISGRMDENGERIINDFRNFIQRAKPDLIGVNCTSVCLQFAVKMLERLEKKPLAVFGGVGATVDYINLINNKEVADYVCVGFGEECLPKLIENLEGGRGLAEIPNLVYKENGKVIKNRFLQSIDMSKLPLPDWTLFDSRHFERVFKGKVKRWGNFQLRRGCPFNCSYCINEYYHKELGMKIHKFPAQKIIEEIKHLSREYQLDIVRIFDECFGFGDLEYYKEFARLYKKAIGLPTIIETRPESITSEVIEILKDINCISVSIGIEVGNENQRKEMLNRSCRNDVIVKSCDLLRRAKIRISSYNIVGFPYDTREKIFETINLNKRCNPDFINAFLFTPFPKTKLRETCLGENLLTTDAIVDYGKRSVVKNPNLHNGELYGLFKTFQFYVKFPRQLYPLIKRAERFDKTADFILKLLEKIMVTRYGY